MNPEEMTIEQHLTVLYLLDIAQGEDISAVDVDGFSDLPEGAVLLRLTQTQTSGQRPKLTYEIARDGSHRRHSPQEKELLGDHASERLAGPECGVVPWCLVPVPDADRPGMARAPPAARS